MTFADRNGKRRILAALCAALCAGILMACAAQEVPEETDPGILFGVSYVTDDCSYMSMLSSYIPIDGDSGYRYYFLEDSFVFEFKENGTRRTVENVTWEWDKHPYDDEKWGEMRFFGAGSPAFPGSPYGNNQYLDLGDGYFLLKNGEGISIVKYYTERDGINYIWSIYHLTPEDA